jgi:hypothetical protein
MRSTSQKLMVRFIRFRRTRPKEAWLVADSFDVFLPRTNLYQH